MQNAFLASVKAMHDAGTLPKNIQVRPRPLGQQDFMQQTLVGMGTSLILSIMLVFLLMVALYNSYRSPFIIMFSVPLAACGALGALWITHETLNLFSLIGTILLVGIVTKNGILLVDYANTLRERGEDKVKAIQESAYTRFRPIIMTSISVIAGNIPLALALEPGSSTRQSLGVVVIGGITSSLLLTLVLVPVMYALLPPSTSGGAAAGRARDPAARNGHVSDTRSNGATPGAVTRPRLPRSSALIRLSPDCQLPKGRPSSWLKHVGERAGVVPSEYFLRATHHENPRPSIIQRANQRPR